MKLVKFLLDPRGRISRKQFWFAWLFILILGYGVSQAKDQSGTLLGSVIGIYLTITVYGKRLHDLDKSAWKLSWPYGLTALCLAVSTWMTYSFMNDPFSKGGSLNSMYYIVSIAAIAPLAIWLAYTLIVGVPAGMPGDNRFGPSPLEQNVLAVKPGSE